MRTQFPGLDNQEIFRQLLPANSGLHEDDFWNSYIQSNVLIQPPPVSAHLAIFIEPYLQYVLDGKKSIESRFSVRQTAPYGVVNKGDVVLIKRASGPVVGVCLVANVWDYELDPDSLSELQSEFATALCADNPEFWAMRADATYATLLEIEKVRQVRDIYIQKSDRRGWVVLKKRTRQLLLWKE